MTRPISSTVPVSFAYGRRYSSGGIHKGIDYSDGREGHAVLSMLPGVVIHAGYGGWGPAYGQHVVIRTPASVLGKVRYTCLAHLRTESVRVGQSVKAGQPVGTSGGRAGQRYSGNSTGPHLHAQLGYENRYDRYIDPAPAIAYAAAATKPTPAAERWFGALAWNLAVSDPVRGKATWHERLPGIMRAIKHYDRDVLLLTEACEADDLPKFKLALSGIGFKVAVYAQGRCIVVRNAIKVGRTKIVALDDDGPANDVKRIVLAEIFPDGTSALAECGHFEFRDGAAYDATRAAQAKQTRSVVEATCKEWAIPVDRALLGNDENARIGTNAAFGTSWPDLATHAPVYGNKAYSTLVTWSGDTSKSGYRPDKFRVHKSRPVIGGSTSLTFAGDELSDHLPVIATLARL
ncbi:M23 family metallopeptidase [Aeromicrobium sp.]|uniref:M23 family metallopeptidase n=1 Tax=Aeromicrobium sp. TaxID=1871063 RepID=UPI0030BB5E6D